MGVISNKKLGTEFENQMCEFYALMGYWVHFIVPDARGAQPFDIIAVRDNKPIVFDCKTSATHRFSINRLEENQIMAFSKWIKCGNSIPYVAVLYDDKVYMISYIVLDEKKVIDLRKEVPFIDGFNDNLERLKEEKK